MPQILAVMIAGAGIYKGLQWISNFLERKAEETAREAEEIARGGAEAHRVPKDLGVLVLDPETNVYRPRASKGA